MVRTLPGHTGNRSPGPPSARDRVIRSGGWFNEPEALRSTNRHRHPPNSRQTNLGLRLI